MSISIMVTIRRENGKQLRDICDDLRARLKMMEGVIAQEEAAFQERQAEAATEHKKRMETFKDALVGYRNMLVLEEAFANASMIGNEDKIGPLPDVNISLAAQKPPLPEFFIAQVKEHGPMTKEQLRQAALAADYFSDGSGGRATHVTLANITRSKRLIYTDGGKFTAVNNPAEALL